MIRYTDMDEATKKEVMDVCTNACEKHTANNELVSPESHNIYRNSLWSVIFLYYALSLSHPELVIVKANFN